jgi:hypothetical protein
MSTKNYDKKFYICAFFRDFRKRVENIKKIINIGFEEEGAILALCQIDALSNFRYNPKPGEQQKYFKKLLMTYSKTSRIPAYANDFYRHFRCKGVHLGRIPYSLRNYRGKHLAFSLKGIVSILENCLSEIEKECVNNKKWPHEL